MVCKDGARCFPLVEETRDEDEAIGAELWW